jgi:hypothetical protein
VRADTNFCLPPFSKLLLCLIGEGKCSQAVKTLDGSLEEVIRMNNSIRMPASFLTTYVANNRCEY